MKKLSILLMSLIILISCDDDDNQNENSTETFQKELNIYTNVNDPLIVEAKDEYGNSAQYYGKKDENGFPLSFDHLRVVNEGEEFEYTFDELGRPTNLLAANGTRFEIEWLSNNSYALTIYAPDGESQINTIVDLTKSNQNTTNKTMSDISRTRKSELSYKSIIPQDVVHKTSNTGHNIFLNTFQCSEKTNIYNPKIAVQNENGKFLRYIYPENIGIGEYASTIPNDLAPSVNGGEVCEDIASFINTACDLPMLPDHFFSTMCLSISTALAGTGIGASIAPQVFVACEGLVLTYEVSCALFGAADTAGIKDALCNANFINQTWTEDLKFIGVIDAMPNNITSEIITTPGQGPYPTLNINVGEQTNISSFYINPSAPSAGQDYNAIARISCVKPGMLVELSVLGTDGYSDTVSYTTSSNDALGEFTLNVPGAASGIQDTVTIKVYLELGEVLTRNVSIVFGG